MNKLVVHVRLTEIFLLIVNVKKVFTMITLQNAVYATLYANLVLLNMLASPVKIF